ncbi:protein of unknown function [Pseudomonas mediterranea]
MVFGCSHCSCALLIRFFFEMNIPEDFHTSLAYTHSCGHENSSEAMGFICGEGIYPRWAAKQP